MMNREEDFEGREGRRKGRKEVEGMQESETGKLKENEERANGETESKREKK